MDKQKGDQSTTATRQETNDNPTEKHSDPLENIQEEIAAWSPDMKTKFGEMLEKFREEHGIIPSVEL